MADGARWTVYEIRPDGTVCSRYAGKPEKAAPKPTFALADDIDYSMTCAYRKRGRHHKMAYCDEYVVKGTTLCRKHQWVNRYVVA